VENSTYKVFKKICKNYCNELVSVIYLKSSKAQEKILKKETENLKENITKLLTISYHYVIISIEIRKNQLKGGKFLCMKNL